MSEAMFGGYIRAEKNPREIERPLDTICLDMSAAGKNRRDTPVPAGDAAEIAAGDESVVLRAPAQEDVRQRVINVLASSWFARRGMAPTRPPPTADEIVGEMEARGYVRLDARAPARGRRDVVVVLVLAPAPGKYAASAAELRGLLEGVCGETAAREGRLAELVVVADDGFFRRAGLLDAVRGAAREADAVHAAAYAADLAARRPAAGLAAPPPAKGAGDPAGAAPFVAAYPFRYFLCDAPSHVAVFPHRVVSDAERAELEAWYRIGDAAYPTLYADDPAAVWCGARPGHLVEVMRRSGAAPAAPNYRRVVLAGSLAVITN
jgi:DNA-directed RNA polymerase subunit H (RpoH/RPB5)